MLKNKLEKNVELDNEQVLELTGYCQEDAWIIKSIQASKGITTYSISENGCLQALLIFWENSFHPNSRPFRLYVHPEKIHTDIGEQILNPFINGLKDLSQVQTSVWESYIYQNELYRKLEFKEIRSTYMPVLQLNGRGSYGYLDDLHHNSVLSLKEVEKRKPLLKKLAEMTKLNYEQTHKENPVKDMELKEWTKLILSPDSLKDGSLILLDKMEQYIIAYAFLHKSEEEWTAEQGWCGTARKEDIPLIPILVQRQFEYLRKSGYTFYKGEMDSTDPFALEILRYFPFPPCPALITYQKERLHDHISYE